MPIRPQNIKMPNTAAPNKYIPTARKTGKVGSSGASSEYLQKAKAAARGVRSSAATTSRKQEKREDAAPRKVELVRSDVLSTLMEKSCEHLLGKCRPYCSNVATTFALIAAQLKKNAEAAKAEGKEYIPNLFVRSHGELEGASPNSWIVFLDKKRMQFDETHALRFSANLPTMMMYLTGSGIGYETKLNKEPYTDEYGVSHDVYSTRARISYAFGMPLMEAANFFLEHKPHEQKEMSDFYIRRAEQIKAHREGDEVEDPLGESEDD